MRIIAGIYRHRLITYPHDASYVRPTKDRIREAIFSALSDINSKTVLDLYAGSGAMGLEALSRGAKKAIFVDCYDQAIKAIKENLISLKIPAETGLIKQNKAHDALKEFIKNKEKFDLVFLDPPYEKGTYEEDLDIILNGKLLLPSGIIVMETKRDVTVPLTFKGTRKDYHYGDIKIIMLRSE